MIRRSPAPIVLFCTLLLVLGGAAVAWACGAQAEVALSTSEGVSGDSSSGISGTRVTLTGAQFRPGPVEIRWNSIDGPLLGTATGPSFAAQITVPFDQPPNVYQVIGWQEGVGMPSRPFTVTGSAAGASGESATTTGEPAPAEGPMTANTTGRDARPAPAEDHGPPRQPARDTAPSSGGPVATTSGLEVFAPSVAGAASPAAADVQEPARGDAEGSKSADDIASTGRLYSGLESPGVLPSPFDAAIGSETGTDRLTLAVALLGAGLVAMFAGVLVSEARRRRPAAAARRRR